MALDSEANRLKLISAFPDLGNDPSFCIKSEATCLYNCIAWAMGLTDRWVDPEKIPGHWWPNDKDRSFSRQALIAAFKELGFEETNNADFEEGFDKVALYADGGFWTHASRIVNNDTEHSKFGEAWDAYHGRDKFSGTDYGDRFTCMRRPIAARGLSVAIANGKKGTITVNKLPNLNRQKVFDENS